MNKYSVKRKEVSSKLINLREILGEQTGINRDIDLSESQILIDSKNISLTPLSDETPKSMMSKFKHENSCPCCGRYIIIETHDNMLCSDCDKHLSREYDRDLTELEYKYGVIRGGVQ